LLKIMDQAGFSRKDRHAPGTGHAQSPSTRFETKLSTHHQLSR
jgi:hypothetical protein